MCQPGMETVSEGPAKTGEIRSSLTNELIDSNNPTGPIDFIPFSVKKFWLVQKYDEKGQKKWDSMFPYTPENAGLTWGTFEEDNETTGHTDKKFRATCYKVYGMCGAELSDNPQALPVDVLFKSTSEREGKKLVTMMSAFARAGSNAWDVCYRLTTKTVKKEGQTPYCVWQVGGTTRPSTETERQAALEWYNVFKTGAPHEDAGKPQPETNTDDVPF